MSYDRDSLILAHLQLAQNIAAREWRTATHVLKLDDMQSLANWGLVTAADRWPAYCEERGFDPEAIQYFKVYAALRIRGAIRDHIRQEDWATRTLRSKAKVLKEAGQDEGLSVNELSEKTGMSVTEINKVIAKLASRPVSLDAKQGLRDYNPNTDNSEIQLKEDIDTEGIAFANEMNQVFIDTFKKLTPEVQVVLTLHYYSKMDLRSIADLLNLSESKVSQLHQAGVLTVRDAVTKAATESEINA